MAQPRVLLLVGSCSTLFLVVQRPVHLAQVWEHFLGPAQVARKGAGIGFLIGGLVGAGIGWASGDDPPGTFFRLSAGEKAFIGLLAFGLAGSIVGSIAGAALPGHGWEDVALDRLRVSLGPQRDGRFGFGASVRF